jgi:catechol 2,3-dioxygenase-like lactoylglutathione lyase family enzyme
MVGELMETILYVDDMSVAVAFYRDRLGLKVLYPILANYSEAFWVVFETGACKLCLHGGGQRQQGADAPKVVFRVENTARARDELAVRGVRLGDVRSPAPDVFVCDGVDPAGNPFSIESSAQSANRKLD